MVKAGVPITVITVDSCIAGEMVRSPTRSLASTSPAAPMTG